MPSGKTEKKTKYKETVGTLMREIFEDKMPKWERSDLARNLTMQIYRNLPEEDRLLDTGEDIITCENSTNLINDYLSNKHEKKVNIFIIDSNEERILGHAISKSVVDNYLAGVTEPPLKVLVSFCHLFNISLDAFMNDVYKRLTLGSPFPKSSHTGLTFEKAFGIFAKVMFGQRGDNRYVFDTETQATQFELLFPEGKNEVVLHFTYLPINLNLVSKVDNKTVQYQRGTLTFVKRDGMCHVTSQLEVSSQGTRTKYDGFAIIMNPSSNGPTCTCFLREADNDFGIIIMFAFRLSPPGALKRKTRVSECMSVRLTDGTSFVYRLLISENCIKDDMMRYFVSHLKLNTSENTNPGRELQILISDKYITVAKNFFNGIPADSNDEFMYAELTDYFKDVDKEACATFLHNIKKETEHQDTTIHRVNPAYVGTSNRSILLLLGWLGKYGLSARHDKVPVLLDDAVEEIHRELYPNEHKGGSYTW